MMQKSSDFHANYELYKEFLLRFKSDAKYSDFHANQSNLLMGVSFFVFREKGPGTCTRARELLLLVTCTMDVLILLMCLALPSKLASLLS